MKGMKNSPCRAEDKVTARTGLRIVCNIMLHKITHAPKGKVMSCQRKARVPVSITCGSSRNHDTISGEKM